MKRLFHTIHVRIVTLFLMLTTAACSTLILFNYFKSLEETLDLSKQLIASVGQDTISKIDGIAKNAILAAEMARKVLDQGDGIENEHLITLLLHILQKNVSIFSINVATEEGNYLSVMDILLAQNWKRHLQPPEGTKYIVRQIANPQNKIEKWVYLDTELQVIQEVERDETDYDFTQDPWYKEIKNWPSERWESSYLPRGSKRGEGEDAITLSLPLYQEKKFQGAVAVNVNLDTLSNFISHQKIGIHGKLYFLDEKGNVIVPVPENQDRETAAILKLVIQPAFDIYIKKQVEASIYKVNGKEYITYMMDFPLSFNTPWIVAIEVPLLDFTGGLIRIRHETMFLSVSVLILSAIGILIFSWRISKPIKKLSQDVDRIKRFDISETEPINSHIEEIHALESSLKAMRSALRSFSKYIPQEIVKTLVEQGEDLSLGSSRQKVAILFTDIANFTTLVEQTPLAELMPQMATYFDVMSKIILSEQGTIDKYIGDSIMAIWGAPKEIENPILHSCMAAIRCHLAGNLHQDARMPPWKTRFGIHFGEAVVGNFGTNERMNYTAMGDVVNIASRLEGLNKEYKTSILITQAIESQLPPNFIRRSIDVIAVKGRSGKTEVFELLGTQDTLPKEAEELCHLFNKAYKDFHSGNKKEAKSQFEHIRSQFPDDYPTQLYLKKIEPIAKLFDA